MSKSRFSDEVDLLFTIAGDFSLDGETGDFKDTSHNLLQSLAQQVQTVVSSSLGDWKTSPQVGANIAAFAGKPNTEETGMAVQAQVFQSLVSQIGLRPNELRVVVVPVSSTGIAVLIKINPIGQREEIIMSYTYDARDNKIVPRNV